MIHESNIKLSQYEIKSPDYDYIERQGSNEIMHSPERFVKERGRWVSKKTIEADKKTRIMFIGDITCFEKQFEESQQENGYDFYYEFEVMKPVFEQADLVVGNLETMIVPNAPYRTEKYVSEQNFHCNAPIEFLDAIRKSGIDVVTNANNHDLDTGAVGIGVTIDNIEKMGLIQTGTFKTNKKRYELLEVNGIKVAIVAFATEHNNKKHNLTEAGAELLLNDYSKENAATILKQARGEGAEVVFVCIHWGVEHNIVQSLKQEKIARELANLGYDCIIGSHPHVLQPVSFITVGKKEVPVFYSMGNFLSHNIDNHKARSIVACIELHKDHEAVIIKCSYIPIYTSKSYGKKKYVVLPITPNPLDSRNIRKKKIIQNILGNQIDVERNIDIPEYIEKIEINIKKAVTETVDTARVSVFPAYYDDGKFTYALYRSCAYVTGISKDVLVASYSIPKVASGVSVTGIRIGAFENNTIIKKINFGNGIHIINKRICKGCSSLEGFQLGKDVIEIKEEAFAQCESLCAAVIHKNVREIESKAFHGCSGLRTVKISSGVSKIAEDAFDGCLRATFYCEKGSYAEKYAKKHGFKVVEMSLDAPSEKNKEEKVGEVKNNISPKSQNVSDEKLRRIKLMCEATGWTEQEAVVKLQEAEKIGISNGKYVANKC